MLPKIIIIDSVRLKANAKVSRAFMILKCEKYLSKPKKNKNKNQEMRARLENCSVVDRLKLVFWIFCHSLFSCKVIQSNRKKNIHTQKRIKSINARVSV